MLQEKPGKEYILSHPTPSDLPIDYMQLKGRKEKEPMDTVYTS